MARVSKRVFIQLDSIKRRSRQTVHRGYAYTGVSATPAVEPDHRASSKKAPPGPLIKILRTCDHADALNDLAAALASGTGTTVDKAQAAELFQRAAQRGHSRAAANLANLANPQ